MENSAASTPPINGYAGVSSLTPAELEARRRSVERRRRELGQSAGLTAWRITGEILLSMGAVTGSIALAALLAALIGMLIR